MLLLLFSMNRTLVLYVFHEYNMRVKYFIDNCIFQDDNVDFMVICNNTSISFPIPPYVKVLFRENIGFDFGGWSEGLLKDSIYKNYDHYIFVNSSVLGPFLPVYYKGRWTDIYINGLEGNIKLFGSTINTDTFEQYLTTPHVQSYIFSMNRSTLEYLIECGIFSNDTLSTTYFDAIVSKEVLMSTKILEKGWNIGSLMPQYKGIDFTFREKKPEEYGITFLGDVTFGIYHNVLWNEYQLVFIKGNRINVRFY